MGNKDSAYTVGAAQAHGEHKTHTRALCPPLGWGRVWEMDSSPTLTCPDSIRNPDTPASDSTPGSLCGFLAWGPKEALRAASRLICLSVSHDTPPQPKDRLKD